MKRSAIALRNLLLPIALILASYQISLAQSAGVAKANLSGTIRDSQAAAIPAASLSIKNDDTGLVRELVSAENGQFIVPQLLPGNYTITVTADGFEAKSVKCTASLGVTNVVVVVLQPGQTTDVVEVNATATDSLRTEGYTSVNKERIESLPINRRDFIDFTLTSSRVVADRLPAQGIAATSGLSFSGQSARFNNITIDGIDNNDVTSGTVRTTFSQDSVQEFQIIPDSTSAEFGRALGGVVNIVTKGGSNDYHGTLFLLNRNDKAAARDAFLTFKPPFSQYQFGATLGGPIKKDKAFFFTSFERLTVRQNNIVTINDDLIQALRRQGFPASNGPIPFSVGRTTLFGRVDTQITPNDSFYVRYNFGGVYDGAFEPFGGFAAETSGGTERLRDNGFVVSNTYIAPKLNLINETRFLYGKRNQKIIPNGPGPELDFLVPQGRVKYGENVFTPQLREENIYQIVDNVTLTRGRNQIKFGVDYSRTNSPKDKSIFGFVNGGRGAFTDLDFAGLLGMPGLPAFTALQAFDPSLRSPQQQAFLAFLAGVLPSRVPGFPLLDLTKLPLPLAYGQSFGNLQLAIPVSLFSTFIQNDLKLKPNLLIKTGLRYDRNRIAFTPKNDGNFSPRVAIAYQPAKLPQLNLRASYGLFFGTPVFGPAVLAAKSQAGQLTVPVFLFPQSILPFTLPNNQFPQTDTVPKGVSFIPQLALSYQYDRNLRNSYSQQTSAAIDYFFNSHAAASIEYNFVRGVRLLAGRSINPVVNPVPGSTIQSFATGRLMPDKGDITEFESAFDSYYHGVTFTLNYRVTERFNLVADYTFSKIIDNLFDVRTDVAGAPNDTLKPGDERSLSIQDVRNRFVLSGLLNFTNSKNRILKGFLLSTITTLESGRPYNLTVGSDLNMDGDTGLGDRPLGISRNAGVTPGFATIDVRLSRGLSFKEHYQVQAFVEAFNLFNRVNIRQFSTLYPPDAQGKFQLPAKENGRFIVPKDRYLGAFAPRQIQFGFRFFF